MTCRHPKTARVGGFPTNGKGCQSGPAFEYCNVCGAKRTQVLAKRAFQKALLEQSHTPNPLEMLALKHKFYVWPRRWTPAGERVLQALMAQL
jgi:hypothetical protein